HPFHRTGRIIPEIVNGERGQESERSEQCRTSGCGDAKHQRAPHNGFEHCGCPVKRDDNWEAMAHHLLHCHWFADQLAHTRKQKEQAENRASGRCPICRHTSLLSCVFNEQTPGAGDRVRSSRSCATAPWPSMT